MAVASCVGLRAARQEEIDFAVRKGEKDAGDVQRLGESFFNSGQGAAFGFSVAKAYTIRCKTS